MSRHRALSLLALACLALATTSPARAQPSQDPFSPEALRLQPPGQEEGGADALGRSLSYARSLLRRGRFREAARLLDRLVRRRDAAPEALYERARVAFARQSYRRARTHCRRLRRAHPDSPLVSLCEARAFLVWNRTARALEALHGMGEAAARSAEAQWVLGEALRLQGRFDAAEKALRAATRIEPAWPEAWVSLGRLALRRGEEEKAIEAFTTALRAAPDLPEAHEVLARLLPPERALRHARALATLRAERPEGHLLLGRASLALGRHEEALEALRRAAKLAPRRADAHEALGRALLALGRHEEARSAFQRALRIVPNHATALDGLAHALAALEAYEEAIETWRRAADAHPGDPAPLLAAARLALSRNRPVLAEAFARRARRRRPGDPEVLTLLADVAERRGEWEEAAERLEEALRHEQHPERAKRLRERLHALRAPR